MMGWVEGVERGRTARQRAPPSPALRKLSLRQNLITDATEINEAANAGGESEREGWRRAADARAGRHPSPPSPGLEELILQDNQLTEVRERRGGLVRGAGRAAADPPPFHLSSPLSPR